MIKHELVIFLFVGILTVLIDFVTYSGLMWINLLGLDMAKAVGFVAGTIFAYFANRIWTFGHKTHAPGSAGRFIVLYAMSLGANVWVNAFALGLLAPVMLAVEMAFLLATGVSAVLNFLGMKWFVFNENTKEVS
jgi:putative flippase GtrA